MPSATHELSSASATVHNDRMLHEVAQNVRAQNPPRLPLPLSARETTLGDDERDELSASPMPPNAKPSASSAPSQAMRVDEAGTVRNILDAIDQVGDHLYMYTTPEERARIRRATCPSNANFERALHSNPTSSLLSTSVLAVGTGVLLGCMLSGKGTSERTYGNANPTISSTVRRTIDRMLSYA